MKNNNISSELQTMQNNLKLLREQKNLSLEQLSEQVNIALRDLDRLENGDADVDIAHLLKLCEFYGIHPSTIFSQ